MRNIGWVVLAFVAAASLAVLLWAWLVLAAFAQLLAVVAQGAALA